MAKKSSFNVNDLSSWSVPFVLLVSSITVILLVVLIKHFFINDVSNNINAENVEIHKKEQEYSEKQKIIALLPHIRKEVAELEIVRNEAKQYLPTEISMPSLIDNVYLAARDNGIVFDSLTPEKDIDTDYYTIKPISLSAEVGYLSMSSFIEQITTLKRIMNVHSVSFNSLNNEDKISEISDKPLEMKAQLRTYIFKEKQEGKK